MADEFRYDVVNDLRAYALTYPEVSERCGVGNTNWVTMIFAADERPPDGVVERWIDESLRLVAPRAVLARLDDSP